MSTKTMDDAVFYDAACRVFRKAGPADTEAVFSAVSARAEALGIRKIVVATCSGRSALVARERLPNALEVIAVSHVTGFRGADTQELSVENREALRERGMKIVTAAHAFGSVGRGVRNRIGSYQIDEIIAYALRMFGQGTKVAVEITLMAADAGLVRTDEHVIAVGGTKEGVDTALVVRPSTSAHCLDLKVREIVCKPAEF